MTRLPPRVPAAARRSAQRAVLGAACRDGAVGVATRVGAVAVVVVILVGGLLVTPALGIGSRLLALLYDSPQVAEMGGVTWSPDGQRIAFYEMRGRNLEAPRRNADGSGERVG